MASGQLLNDSTAGNTINHLQLTFISSPLYAAAQPVLFTVTAHPESLFPPFELSLLDTVHTIHSGLKHQRQMHSCENNHFTFISQFPWLKIILCLYLCIYTKRSELVVFL